MFSPSPVDPFALCNFLTLGDGPLGVFSVAVEPDQDQAVDLAAGPSAHLRKLWHWKKIHKKNPESWFPHKYLPCRQPGCNNLDDRRQTMPLCWLLVWQFKLTYRGKECNTIMRHEQTFRSLCTSGSVNTLRVPSKQISSSFRKNQFLCLPGLCTCSPVYKHCIFTGNFTEKLSRSHTLST